jgi:predicted Zn-dependent protease
VAALLDLASYAKAKEILLDGPHSLRQKAAFWFDLARCQCQLGEVEAAMKSIGVCIDRDGRFKKEILECADLEAIWQMWKRKDSR